MTCGEAHVVEYGPGGPLDCDLHYSEGGLPTAPTLLLIHPMGADLTFWEGCRAIWQRRYRCVAVDLRGTGQSPPADRPLTIEAQAADLDAVLAALRLEQVIPVGCAVGAMVAAAYAAAHSTRCPALVLSNPCFRIRPEGREMLARRATAVKSGGIAAVLPDAVDNAFAGCSQDERREAYLRRFAAQDAASYALQIEGILDADLSHDVTRIVCPTLIVAGGNDRLLPPDHAHEIHAALPNSRLVLIEEGAHFIPYQRPQEFASLVADFLSEVPVQVPS